MNSVTSPEREAACKKKLHDYLTKINQTNVDQNVEFMMGNNLGGVRARFDYFAPRIPDKSRALISGCAAGSEMVVAREYGFKDIYGTEVQPYLVEICAERLMGIDGFHVVLYDGNRVPYTDNFFTAIVSGHIIEHTPSPYEYLREHMRVLAPGGVMFLEFPYRYHPVELHTNLPSLEYLPYPLRNWALRFRASRFSSYTPQQRFYYNEILRDIRPMSLWQIKWFLFKMGQGAVIHHTIPAPGFMRVLVRK